MSFMFGRPSLRELIAEMREESRRRDKESKRRDEESKRRDEEFRRRGEEFKSRDEEFKRSMEESDRRWAETREFHREILLRNEKVYTSVIAQLEENTAKVRSSTEETHAQTQALLRVIDRMDESGGAAAA
jgi:colicin import membrane protein